MSSIRFKTSILLIKDRKGKPVRDMSEERESSNAVSPTGPHRFEMKAWISCAPFERLLNMEILEASNGEAILNMPFLVDYAQGGGLMHGGAIVSLADTAVAMAIKSLLPPRSHFGTISAEIKFLLPIHQGIVTAKARVVHREGRLIKGHATVYDEDQRAVMEFSSTFKVARDTVVEGIIFKDGSAQDRE
jgi:acyl-CoA thioesterase